MEIYISDSMLCCINDKLEKYLVKGVYFFIEHVSLYYTAFSTHMYTEDLALNNLQWLICHKTQPNQILYI